MRRILSNNKLANSGVDGGPSAGVDGGPDGEVDGMSVVVEHGATAVGHGQSAAAAQRWFDAHAPSWSAAGLVSAEQIGAIRAFEHMPGSDEIDGGGEGRGAEPTTDTGGAVGPQLSIVAELAVYLGSVVALMSGAMLAGRSWEWLGTAGRTAIGLAVAALGFSAGARLAHFDDARMRRLMSFMWLIGTGGIALTAGILADRAEFEEPGWNVMIVGLAVFPIGALLWRNLDRPLQVLTTAVGAGLSVGGAGALLSIPAVLAGVLTWIAAIVIGGLAVAGRLRPELYVLAVASVFAMIGSFALADWSELAATLAATATAAGIVAVALIRHHVALLVLGVIAFLQSLQALLMSVLNGAAAAAIVAVTGIAVVGVVITRSTRRA